MDSNFDDKVSSLAFAIRTQEELKKAEKLSAEQVNKDIEKKRILGSQLTDALKVYQSTGQMMFIEDDMDFKYSRHSASLSTNKLWERQVVRHPRYTVDAWPEWFNKPIINPFYFC